MSSSSSILVSSFFNPQPQPLRSSSWWHKSSSSSPSQLIHILFTKNKTKYRPGDNICFTSFKNNNNDGSRSKGMEELEEEERRWVREEQRWLREEQRWIREERRWEAQRQTLLSEINSLKLQIKDLLTITTTRQQQQQQGDDSSIANSKLLLQLNKQDTTTPLLLTHPTALNYENEKVNINNTTTTTTTATTLRAGSEGDQVQMLQEALLKLGFYCGEEDEEFATFSSGTERAVKTWQSTIGVPETGIMTPHLLQTLFTSASKEGANGVAANSITQTPEIPLRIVKQVPEPDVSEHRVFLLGENRWEDSSRLKNQNSKTQPNSKGVVKTKCITCRGEGRLLCLECDGTGEPNIEPQFLEWVGEDTKCPYCDGDGHTICDVCQGTGAGAA